MQGCMCAHPLMTTSCARYTHAYTAAETAFPLIRRQGWRQQELLLQWPAARPCASQRLYLLTLHMPDVALALAAGDAAAQLVARGAHRWYFAPGKELLLRTAQPQLDWVLSGVQWTLPYGDFMAIVCEYAVLPSSVAWAGRWDKHLLGADQICRSWEEVCKGMVPTDWEEGGMGELGEKLRAAARHPIVEPSELIPTSDAGDGGSFAAAPQTAHSDTMPAAP